MTYVYMLLFITVGMFYIRAFRHFNFKCKNINGFITVAIMIILLSLVTVVVLGGLILLYWRFISVIAVAIVLLTFRNNVTIHK